MRIELSNVRFARPSGLAYLYVLIYTLRKRGHDIVLTQPLRDDARNYIRRTNFWSLLSQHGFTVPDDWHGYNLGKAPGLIECSLLTTDSNLAENMRSSVLSYDRMRKALAQAGLTGRDRAASVFAELAGNAAEHSLSEYGAFVAAQAYGQLQEIEIAVADVGIGIRAGLGLAEAPSDEAAIRAALREGVTGRRDAGGRLSEGGFGLPTAVAESTRLFVRSGTALVMTKASPPPGEDAEAASVVAHLDGTLVVADVSS